MNNKLNKIFKYFLSILMLLNLIGCDANNDKCLDDVVSNESEDEIIKEETDNTFKFEYVDPEDVGIDSLAINNMFDELNDGVLSCLILKDGKIIGEYFADGYDETSLFSMQSVSKSITGLLIGIAIDEGYINSVDDLVLDYLPILQEEKYKEKQDITIKELLDHTSGLVSTDSSLWADWRSSSNWITYLLDKPLAHKPGTYFEYSTGNTHILSAILENVTGMSLLDYANKVLFEHLDIEDATMEDISKNIYLNDESTLIDTSSFYTDPSGVSDGGNGFSLSALDMAKIGLLYAQNGKWMDKQIVSSEYIKEATTTQAIRNSDGSNYGYCLWTNRSFGNKKYIGYFGQGYYGQFIFVIPDINLVVTFTSYNEHTKALDYQNYVNEIVDGIKE